MKQKFKKLFGFLIFIALLVVASIALLYSPISDRVGTVVGVAGEKIRTIAKTVVVGGAGVLLGGWGVASLAVPVLGIPLIIIGAALLLWAAYPYISNGTSTGKM